MSYGGVFVFLSVSLAFVAIVWNENVINIIGAVVTYAVKNNQPVYKLLSNMSAEGTEKTSCIFCNIVNKIESTEILYEDDLVCVFRDIKPASDFHILTIPKRHIEDVKALTPADKDLVSHMLSVAHKQLEQQGYSLSAARLGYHWPPFRSVHHLHLHAIAPENKMSWMGRVTFMKNSYWFVSPEYVQKMLE